MTGNRIEDEGAIAMSKMLRVNTKLALLDMSGDD